MVMPLSVAYRDIRPALKIYERRMTHGAINELGHGGLLVNSVH